MQKFSLGDCTIDPEADAVYIPLRTVGPADVVADVLVEDPRLQGYVVLNLDAGHRLVGIELIGVSTLTPAGFPFGVAPTVRKRRRDRS